MSDTTALPPERHFHELQNAAFAALAARTRPGLAPTDANPHTADIDIADLTDLFAPAAGMRETLPEYGTVKLIAYRFAYVLHFTAPAALARWIAWELRRLGAEADVVDYFERVATAWDSPRDTDGTAEAGTAFQPFVIDPNRIGSFATAATPADSSATVIEFLQAPRQGGSGKTTVDVRFPIGSWTIGGFDPAAAPDGDAAQEDR